MENSVDFERVRRVREQFPAEGLFAEKEWLISPEPFFLESGTVDLLERLGHWLFKFVRASNLLYRLSRRGKQPEWIARYLDAGKPRELLELSSRFPDQLPQVIRPDLILMDQGFMISELDSVPGGIGLTAWLNRTYAGLGFDVVGGADGMVDGFHDILPEGAIAVSDESTTYRPEMQWLSKQLSARFGPHWEVVRAEDWRFSDGVPVYRFFEMFDLPNLPSRDGLLAAAAQGRLSLTPPPKPSLEEKMWFALFWAKPLQAFWRRALRDRHWRNLQKVFPQTWVIDPEPVPHHAVIPWLEIQRWEDLKKFSHKNRDFVLKISGFSEQAWGSRGVFVGSDLPQSEWAARLDQAITSFRTNPFILQRFHKGGLFAQKYLDPETKRIETMRGRVRLCPYYFINQQNEIRLGGALATIVPADKKLVHGMRDGILVPAAIAPG